MSGKIKSEKEMVEFVKSITDYVDEASVSVDSMNQDPFFKVVLNGKKTSPNKLRKIFKNFKNSGVNYELIISSK